MIKRIICFVLAGISTIASASDLTLSERYSQPWRDDFHLGITKAFAAKSIRECGQYKFRESSRDKNEFLVYCTRDGRTWKAFIVWPNIGEVMGPYAPDSSLK